MVSKYKMKITILQYKFKEIQQKSINSTTLFFSIKNTCPFNNGVREKVGSDRSSLQGVDSSFKGMVASTIHFLRVLNYLN